MGNKKLLEMICEIDGSKAHDNRLTSFLGWIRDLVKDGSRLNVRRKRINLGGRGGMHPPETRKGTWWDDCRFFYAFEPIYFCFKLF